MISDMSEFRLQLARKFGATRTVHAQREDIVRVVRSMSNEKGFERSFECVGSEQTLKQAIDCVRTNGLVTDVGIFERPRIQLDVSVLVSREIRLQGSQGYCWDFEDALRLVSELKAERLITHVFPLEETQQAFETLMDSTTDAVKVCIVNK